MSIGIRILHFLYFFARTDENWTPQWCSGNIIPSQGIALGSIPSCGICFLARCGQIPRDCLVFVCRLVFAPRTPGEGFCECMLGARFDVEDFFSTAVPSDPPTAAWHHGAAGT